MEHRCNKEKEIDLMSLKLDKLGKVVYGNGEQGIVSITQNLVDNMEDLSNSIFSIEKDVKVLLQFQIQTETREAERKTHQQERAEWKKEKNIDKRWKIGLLITSIISIIGLIITVISIYGKHV